jgi:transposase InsO family protein
VTTDSNHRKPVALNIFERRFDGWNINRAWVSDITYLSTVEGWFYPAVVMDLASRRIAGWSMSNRLHADLICAALRAAYRRRKPGPGLIMHIDRGRPVRERPLPEADCRFLDVAIDEPQGRLLGADGEHLQDAEGRTCLSTSIRDPGPGATRHR